MMQNEKSVDNIATYHLSVPESVCLCFLPHMYSHRPYHTSPPPHALSASFGSVRMSFMISLSLSPTTMKCQPREFKIVGFVFRATSVNDTRHVKLTARGDVPALPLFQSTVTGLWNALSFALNLLNASLLLLAPETTDPAFDGPRYSKIVLN